MGSHRKVVPPLHWLEVRIHRTGHVLLLGASSGLYVGLFAATALLACIWRTGIAHCGKAASAATPRTGTSTSRK